MDARVPMPTTDWPFFFHTVQDEALGSATTPFFSGLLLSDSAGCTTVVSMLRPRERLSRQDKIPLASRWPALGKGKHIALRPSQARNRPRPNQTLSGSPLAA